VHTAQIIALSTTNIPGIFIVEYKMNIRQVFRNSSWCLQRNPRSPDFRHKVIRKALWIYGWSTPPWVKAMLNLAGEGKMHPRLDYHTKHSQDTTQGDR